MPPRGTFAPPARSAGRKVPAGLFLVVVLLVALVCGIGGGLAGGVVGAERAKPTPSKSKTTPSTGNVVDRVLPSVVKIEAEGLDGNSVGSGFVYKKNYILTNNHVIESAKDGGDIRVRFHNGDFKDATVKGSSATFDIGMLEITDGGGMQPVRFADSDKAEVGDEVIAIGAPLDLAETTTTGIVSARDRAIPFNEDATISALQIDASVNPGNSGGPLFDRQGRVLGVNFAGKKASKYERGSNGLNFAIPEEMVRRTADQIIETGKSTHAVMGTVTDGQYEETGAKIVDQSVDGAEPVEPGGPADKAGLQAGDVVTKFDGKLIYEAVDMVAAIRATPPNSTVKVSYERNGQSTTANVTLGEEDDAT